MMGTRQMDDAGVHPSERLLLGPLARGLRAMSAIRTELDGRIAKVDYFCVGAEFAHSMRRHLNRLIDGAAFAVGAVDSQYPHHLFFLRR